MKNTRVKQMIADTLFQKYPNIRKVAWWNSHLVVAVYAREIHRNKWFLLEAL